MIPRDVEKIIYQQLQGFPIGDKLMPIEIKSGKTINRDFFTGLERWTALAGKEAFAPSLVYGGTESSSRKGVGIFGWPAAGGVLDQNRLGASLE